MTTKLSSAEKQTLLGPLVIGCILGAFVAYAAFAMNSEFRLQGIAIADWQMIAESALGFVLAVFCTVGVLGVLPVFIHRIRSRKRGEP